MFKEWFEYPPHEVDGDGDENDEGCSDGDHGVHPETHLIIICKTNAFKQIIIGRTSSVSLTTH